jgi:hypothetical protein
MSKIVDKILDKILIYLIIRRWKTLWYRCSDNKEYAIRRKRYEGIIWELNQNKDGNNF